MQIGLVPRLGWRLADDRRWRWPRGRDRSALRRLAPRRSTRRIDPIAVLERRN